MTELHKDFYEKSFAEQVTLIRNQFADEWEELVTGPGTFSVEEMRYADVVRTNGKLPKNHKWVVQTICRICQDYHIGHDQTDAILAEITE